MISGLPNTIGSVTCIQFSRTREQYLKAKFINIFLACLCLVAGMVDIKGRGRERMFREEMMTLKTHHTCDSSAGPVRLQEVCSSGRHFVIELRHFEGRNADIDGVLYYLQQITISICSSPG